MLVTSHLNPQRQGSSWLVLFLDKRERLALESGFKMVPGCLAAGGVEGGAVGVAGEARGAGGLGAEGKWGRGWEVDTMQ